MVAGGLPQLLPLLTPTRQAPLASSLCKWLALNTETVRFTPYRSILTVSRLSSKWPVPAWPPTCPAHILRPRATATSEEPLLLPP